MASALPTAAAAGRKLKAQSSHPEAPDRKTTPNGEDTPVKDDEDMPEATLTASSMKDLMKTLRQDINADFKTDLRSGLEDLRKDVCEELKTIRQETKNEFKTIRNENKIASEKTDEKFMALETRLTVLESKPATTVGNVEGDDQDENPECLVVVSGFPWDTAEATIITKLEGFIEENGLKEKIVEMFCYSDPATAGMLKFRSPAAQRTFLRSSRKLTGKAIGDDRFMKFGNKLTVVERAAEKRLGYIKHELMTKLDVGVKAVKIHWKKHEVEYQKEKIFKTNKTGERMYFGVGKDLSTTVEAKVKDWLDKRQSEDSD